MRLDFYRPAHRWGKAGCIALFIILALTALQCARLGAASVFAEVAHLEFERRTSASRPPRIQDVSRVVEYFSHSLRFASNNPWALEGLGALDFARMRASRTQQEALAATRDAHRRFRQALQQRPTSPFLWAYLALSKLYLDEIDAELFAALRHADELGTWEPAIQQTVLFVGLAAWQDLDSGLRQSVVRILGRGALRNAETMFEIVKSYRRYDLICDIGKYASIAGPDCSQAAITAEPGGSLKKGNRQ